MRISSILVKVLNRLDALSNDAFEKEIGHKEHWRAIDGLIHSDAIGDQFDLWRLREQEIQKTLARLSIDPKTYEYDLKKTLPSVLCLVELSRMLEAHEPILEDSSVAMWLHCVEASLPEIDRLSVAWGYQQVEARKRTKTAGDAAAAGALKQLDRIKEAIEKYDPGPWDGPKKRTKKARVATILKLADRDGWPDRDKLPVRLDKYLDKYLR